MKANTNPILSIITINLNNSKGLEKTMKSVFDQTSKEFEYIVIDGASTDGSLELIKQYDDKISYWVSERDSGIYAAMNKGIAKAQGKYLQFLNSGDYLVNESTIENVIRTLSDCSIYYGNMIKIKANKKTYRNSRVDTNSFLSFYRGSLNHSPAFIKKELFDKYGLFDEKLKIVSDWKFFLIAVGINNEPVEYINLDISYFDLTGISATNKELDHKERRQVFEEYLPKSILSDYDKYWFAIEQMNRLNRYKITKSFVWFIERILFKWEKWFRNRY